MHSDITHGSYAMYFICRDQMASIVGCKVPAGYAIDQHLCSRAISMDVLRHPAFGVVLTRLLESGSCCLRPRGAECSKTVFSTSCCKLLTALCRALQNRLNSPILCLRTQHATLEHLLFAVAAAQVGIALLLA